jgi:hypothetical protein
MKQFMRGTRINFNPVNVIKLYKYALEDLFPFLISHHPNCKRFDKDVFKIGEQRVCIGCSIGYPTFFLTTVILLILSYILYIYWDLLLLIALVLYTPLILKYLGLTNHKSIKIIAALCLGMGSATSLWGLIHSPINIAIWLPIFLIINIIVMVSGYRIRRMIRQCDRCRYTRQWYRCPGFRDIIINLDNDGFGISDSFRNKPEGKKYDPH